MQVWAKWVHAWEWILLACIWANLCSICWSCGKFVSCQKQQVKMHWSEFAWLQKDESMISYPSTRTTFVTVTILFNLLSWKQFNPWSGIRAKWWGAAADSHFWYVERVVCVFFLGGMFWRCQMDCCCFQFTNVHEWGCYNRRVDVGNGRNTWRQSCTLWPPVSS